MEAESETSEDAILGGRLRVRQPLRGHRVGHDAILLAAATGACAGEQAIDLGSGVGAAGLALAVRIPELKVTLVEIDAALCALAANNARLNHMDDRVNAVTLDAENLDALKGAGFFANAIDRVLMNPHSMMRGASMPHPIRAAASRTWVHRDCLCAGLEPPPGF